MKYIKAGSAFLQKAKDTGKICRLNIKIYSESSLYIKKEYKCFLLHFLKRNKFFPFLSVFTYCDLVRKLSLLQFIILNPKIYFLIYLPKFIKILIFWWYFSTDHLSDGYLEGTTKLLLF